MCEYYQPSNPLQDTREKQPLTAGPTPRNSNGFSVPITCSCNADRAVLSGCSLDLWSMGSCAGDAGTDNGKGACANPLRPDNSAKLEATSFFAPCEGAAFTWPRDDANSEGKCQAAEVTCCIGSAADGCPVNPKQKGAS